MTKKVAEPLEFGSAIHEGLEVLYDPKRWHEKDRTLVLVEAHAAFMRYMNKWRANLQKVNQWEVQKERHLELVELGKAMIDYYVVWVAEGNRDEHWEPVHTEVEFEIPIPIPNRMMSSQLRTKMAAYDFSCKPLPNRHGELDWDDMKYLYHKGQLVLYQGRIDLIVLDLRTGRYWIVDHKTAAQFGSTLWFDMDTQTRSYGWAAKQVLGIDVQGVMFNRLRKKVPVEPEWLTSSQRLSMNMQQKTTPELFRKAIRDRGLDPNAYANFLSKFEGQEYVERLEAVHSRDALQVTEEGIVMETIDMLGDPLIYPNPGMFNCNNCEFYAPCQAKHDGLDDIWVLDHSGGYVQRAQEAD